MEVLTKIPTWSVLFALIILSLSFNIFLFRRMNLYYKAAKKFGEWFYGVSYKYSKLTGKPVVVNFKDKEFVIQENHNQPITKENL